MKKIIITGDISTRDKLKMEGFIKAFSKIGHVEYVEPNLRDNIINRGPCDILFGESADWFHVDYTNIKNVFMWCIIDPYKFLEISEKYTNTNFFICSKSVIHIDSVSKEYIKRYDTPIYMEGTFEEIDLLKFSEFIGECELMDENLYKFKENLYYMYLPCSLSSSHIANHEKRDIDITYFGTRENRPGVTDIINQMSSLGYKVTYNHTGIYIGPDECIEYYKRSLITLHEQVGPVHLEFPVRFGEASYCGSTIFSLGMMGKLAEFAQSNDNVPAFRSFNNKEELIKEAICYIDTYGKKEDPVVVKDGYTYDTYCKKIIDLSI